VYRRFVWRRFVEETFCRGDVLSRRRFAEETFCRGDVLYVRRILYQINKFVSNKGYINLERE
jgi:hypothetical protein